MSAQGSGTPPQFVTATITVSGYPAIPAVSVINDGHVIATAVNSADFHGLFARQRQVATTVRGATSDYARCEGCRRWCLRRELGGEELGIDRYCITCRTGFVAVCLQTNRRLPVASEEFWCAGCRDIVPLAERAPKDADGRVRQRCQACRRAQLERANERRKMRRRRSG